jgi:serine/threonine-protein phosphatase PGAM5
MSIRHVLALLLVAATVVGNLAGAQVRTVVLVRHGHYERIEGGDERTTMGLSTQGAAQARMTATRLAATTSGFDAQVVSPLRRARETAAAIGEALPNAAFHLDDDLAECTPITRRAEAIANESPDSLADCEQQLERAFARYLVPAEGTERRDLLVCHGNVIRYLVTRALGVDPKAWLEMSVRHASLTVIRIEHDGRMKVIAVGDAGHLPESLQSGATGDSEPTLQRPIPPMS